MMEKTHNIRIGILQDYREEDDSKITARIFHDLKGEADLAYVKAVIASCDTIRKAKALIYGGSKLYGRLLDVKAPIRVGYFNWAEFYSKKVHAYYTKNFNYEQFTEDVFLFDGKSKWIHNHEQYVNLEAK